MISVYYFFKVLYSFFDFLFCLNIFVYNIEYIDIGHLGVETEASKHRHEAASVENVGTAEMQSRNNHKSNEKRSKFLAGTIITFIH